MISEDRAMTQDEQQYRENCNPFRNIPRKKLDIAVEKIKNRFSDDNGILTIEGGRIVEALQRYYETNIPVDYWFREMSNFKGSKILVDYYNKVTKSISYSYDNGTNICFAGSHGNGKSLTISCILKRVVESAKYDALYVNLADIVSFLTSKGEDRETARNLLLSVDFLAIDEFDDRFMGSDNASDLFGRILESVLRTRIQNQLPIFLCTNSPNVKSIFAGPLQSSINSLMRKVKIIPILGKDFR